MANYSDDIFEKANAELRRRKDFAEFENERRRRELCSRSPELKNILDQQSRLGSELLGVMSQSGNYMEKFKELREKSIKLKNDKDVLIESLTGDKNYLDVNWFCKNCEDTGFKNGRRCACMEALLNKYASEELTRNCDIKLSDFTEFNITFYPDDLGNSVSPRFKMKKIFDYCVDYADKFTPSSPSLLFYGKTGLGKTLLSSCIAKAVSEKGFKVVFGQTATFLSRIEDEHFQRVLGDTKNLLIESDLLILDDFGSEFKTAFTESAIYEIINARINTGRPSIISTNYSVKELDTIYNERIVSRITGLYTPLMFLGKDIRPLKRSF